MEEVRQTTTTVEENNFNRDRVFTLSRALWRDFGPLVVGAVVLIVVLVGGWTLFKKNSASTNPQETVLDQQANADVVLPESTTNLTPSGGAATASPTPSPTPTATPTATKGAATASPTPSTLATKGGQLPKTGPEAIFGLLSLASVAGGYLLNKKAKKLL